MLRQVKIKNFQSIKDLQYDFIDGLNIIIAENGTGKSILNKIINLLVNYKKYTIKQRKQFISFWSSKSDIFFSSDEETYWVEIFSNNINYYKKSVRGFEFESNELPSGLIDILSLLISSNGFIGNLITSKQSKLLVDSEDAVNTEIMGLVVNDEKAELIINTCEERLKEINSELKTKIAVRDSLEKELSKVGAVNYSHIESSVNRVFTSIDVLETLVTCSEIIERVTYSKSIGKCNEGSIDFLSILEMSRSSLEKIVYVKPVNFDEEGLSILSDLTFLNDKLNNIIYKKSLINNIKHINFNENLLGLMTKFEKIKFLLSNVSYSKLPKLEKLDSLSKLEEISTCTGELLQIMSNLSNLKLDNDKLKLELDSYGGENFDCPIYGTIKFVNEECIHISN